MRLILFFMLFLAVPLLTTASDQKTCQGMESEWETYQRNNYLSETLLGHYLLTSPESSKEKLLALALDRTVATYFDPSKKTSDSQREFQANRYRLIRKLFENQQPSKTKQPLNAHQSCLLLKTIHQLFTTHAKDMRPELQQWGVSFSNFLSTFYQQKRLLISQYEIPIPSLCQTFYQKWQHLIYEQKAYVLPLKKVKQRLGGHADSDLEYLLFRHAISLSFNRLLRQIPFRQKIIKQFLHQSDLFYTGVQRANGYDKLASPKLISRPQRLCLALQMGYETVKRYAPPIPPRRVTPQRINFLNLFTQNWYEGLDPHSTYHWGNNANVQIGYMQYLNYGLIYHPARQGLRIRAISLASPLQKHLHPGDLITHINGKFAQSILLAEQMLSANRQKPLSLTIQSKEGKIRIQHLPALADSSQKWVHMSMLTADIAYLRIALFTPAVLSQVQSQMKTLGSQHPLRKLIIDLRNNPGGFGIGSLPAIMQTLVNLINLITQGKKAPGPFAVIRSLNTSGKTVVIKRKWSAAKHKILDGNIVILVNGQTASFAELFTCVLRDYNHAIVVGNKTFGKGTIQQFDDDMDGFWPEIKRMATTLRLTSFYYFCPSGHSPQKTGIIPDQIISFPAYDRWLAALKKERLQRQRGSILNERDYTKALPPKNNQGQERLPQKSTLVKRVENSFHDHVMRRMWRHQLRNFAPSGPTELDSSTTSTDEVPAQFIFHNGQWHLIPAARQIPKNILTADPQLKKALELLEM